MAITFVLTGPSAVGKSSLLEEMLKRFSCLEVLKHYTTREMKSRDEGKGEYHFVSEEEFMEAKEKGYFLETSYHYGSWYGTPATVYYESMEKGWSPIRAMNVEGAKSMKDELGDGCVVIFVEAPSFSELNRRMIARDGLASDSRIGEYAEEMRRVEEFDYVLLNDDFYTACNALESLINRQLGKSAKLSKIAI